MCNGVVDQTEPLTGADPSALRLRLVNGWIWINDLTSGTLWIAGTDTELERIDDWGNTLGSEGDEPDDNPGDQDEGDTQENPDIGEIRDPEIDEDGVNEPPVGPRRRRPDSVPISRSSSTSSPTTRTPTAMR